MADFKNPDIRRRQDEALVHMRRATAGIHMSRHRSILSPVHAQQLQTLHSTYWHQSMSYVPDGWFDLLKDFLEQVDELGDLVDSVSIRIECEPACKAYVFPEMSRWHPHQVASLRAAQRAMYLQSQQTCERCGRPGAPVKFGDRATFFLCSEHATEAESEVAPTVAKLQRRAELYEEMSILWPSTGRLLDLDMAPYLENILYSGLRKIKALVIESGFEGHIHVTMIQHDLGALYVGVRYVDLPWSNVALMMEISEILREIEWSSDRASLKMQEARNGDE